eukprot:7491585-Pyramimonas_sp.AAC.1
MWLLAGAADLRRWSCIPSQFTTRATRPRIFCMLVESSCSVYNLRRLHENYPFRTFLMLESADVVPDICNEKECRLDEWTLQYMTVYRPKLQIDPRDVNALTDLLSTAMDVIVESVAVEVGHAAVRRCLGQLSYHCRTARLEQASARWAL